jgi:hypothetical protein
MIHEEAVVEITITKTGKLAARLRVGVFPPKAFFFHQNIRPVSKR